MKFIVYSLFLHLILVQVLSAQTPQYEIIATNEVIKIDGILNEASWNAANAATQFTQWVPNPDQPSQYASIVKMVYGDHSLYIGATLYQAKELQLHQMTARDELNRCNADVFSVYLDTYHDQQNGFVFKVSSAGVQQDERISGGSEYGDITWDAVWNAKVSSDHEKWVVEMEIPYSAIRFAKTDEQEWGLNFTRLVRKKNETSYWSPISVQRQGFLAQEGIMTGLHHVKPPVRLFLYPYLTLGTYHRPSDVQVENGINKSGGLDIKYGVNESFTIDATLVPDFSQVISDNLIRNLSPFEQQLNENRPFFTEGTELFNKAKLFYTRRVGAQPGGYYDVLNTYGDTSLYEIKKNPNVTTLYNAIKLSGRTKKNVGIGIFNAIGAPMFATIKDKKQNKTFRYQTEPLANYNVIVIDKPLKGQSFFNFTNTNMMKNGSAADANVSSAEWLQFTPSEKHAINLVVKCSNTFDEKRNTGTSLYGEYKKTAGKFRYSVRASLLSPKYDQTDLGIQFDLNESVQAISANYTENKPALPFLQTYRINTEHVFKENVSPLVFKEYHATLNYFWLFKSFWDVTLEMESSPLAPVNFYFLRSFGKPLITNPFLWSGIGGSSDSRKKLFWGYYMGYGFSNHRKTGYFYTEQSLRYLVQSKFEVNIKGSVTRDDGNIGYAAFDNQLNEPVVGQRFVREYEGNLQIKYNYSPTINMTARFRHYNTFISYRSFHLVDSKGQWRNSSYPFMDGQDENFNLQNIDVFFNWIIRPGSRLVISYKQWLQDALLLNDKQENKFYNNVYEVIQTPKAYELAVRLIYFIDYNQMTHKKKVL